MSLADLKSPPFFSSWQTAYRSAAELMVRLDWLVEKEWLVLVVDWRMSRNGYWIVWSSSPNNNNYYRTVWSIHLSFFLACALSITGRRLGRWRPARRRRRTSLVWKAPIVAQWCMVSCGALHSTSLSLGPSPAVTAAAVVCVSPGIPTHRPRCRPPVILSILAAIFVDISDA